MSELSGMEQTEFFDTYIIGTKKIPIDEFLTMAGLDVKIENEKLIVTKKEELTLLQQNMVNGLLGIRDKK